MDLYLRLGILRVLKPNADALPRCEVKAEFPLAFPRLRTPIRRRLNRRVERGPYVRFLLNP